MEEHTSFMTLDHPLLGQADNFRNNSFIYYQNIKIMLASSNNNSYRDW